MASEKELIEKVANRMELAMNPLTSGNPRAYDSLAKEIIDMVREHEETT